ncbi:MAG: hypothetical protein DRP78_01145 [Candidatus Omnitrophota bacterium]|nr:MAG: hypothetical protein DRP78_01145 [Candidatus Omnitrophota bacterium]
MYLKKLEIYGFKSFAEKTTLLFESGVTAIIGPNGTGKSNISDAIRWVLGEQSAKSIRGAKMEEVIFNGTDSLPALNLAEVSLTMSNEARHLPIDYDEIRITRRLFRSGESEYLLNKTQVRLKDIQELLMGTGIGTESYSILGQGRIDAILSSKPEQRRIIFEEASGITKYRRKKAEAMRKLQATEDNLLRLNDIIVEVTRQLNSISRQVSKARRYQKYFAEIKLADTRNAYREYKIMSENRERMRQQCVDWQDKKAGLEKEVSGFNLCTQNLKNDLKQIQAKYNVLNSSLLNSGTQIERNLHTISLNEERIEEFNQRIKSICISAENAETKILELETQFAQIQAELEVFQKEKSVKKQLLDEKQAAFFEIEKQLQKNQDSVKQNKLYALNLLEQHSKIKNEQAILSANVLNANSRLTRLEQDKNKMSLESSAISGLLEQKMGELALSQEKLAQKEVQEKNLRVNHLEYSRQLKSLDTQLQESRQSLAAKQSQVCMLKDLSIAFDGFSNAVKTFMLKKADYADQFNGVCDVLVNLIEVPAGYEVCVESVLSDYLQAVVVEDCDVIERVKKFVNDNDLGRIKFIDLSAIADVDSFQADKQLCPLSSLIKCNQKYQRLINYILKDVFLLENARQPITSSMFSVESAVDCKPEAEEEVLFSYFAPKANSVEISGDFNNWTVSNQHSLQLTETGFWQKRVHLSPGRYKYKFIVDGTWVSDPGNPCTELDEKGIINSLIAVKRPEFKRKTVMSFLNSLSCSARIVLLDGEVHSHSEMVSQPNAGRGLGLISQKAQVKKLQQECLEIEKTISAYAHQQSLKIECLKNIEAELLSLTEQVHNFKILLANKNSEKENIEKTRKKLDTELLNIISEIRETGERRNNLIIDETKSKTSLENISQQILENEQGLVNLKERVDAQILQREELLLVNTEMKTKFSLLNKQEENLQTNFSLISNSLKEQKFNQDSYNTQKDDLTQKIKVLETELRDLKQNTAEIKQTKAQDEDSFQTISAEHSKLSLDFEKNQDEIRHKQNGLDNLKNNLRDLELKQMELNFKIDALNTNIEQVYKVRLPELNLELPEDIDWQAQKEQIAILREKLDKIGTVNLGAVEEEEELTQRADFLNTQKQDLVQAKEILLQAIRKINKTTRDLFLETFEKAKVSFKEYYKLLFNGGDAELYLTQGSDVLESGIEIVIKMPGKKRQSISLLSGGEKTLTAIALLFGIFKIKPTPFCVLDEMDAALDEANIDRFVRVLQEFLKTSQFVIITHNKKTIAMADVMYGVTMLQPGCSKIVSVKFNE